MADGGHFRCSKITFDCISSHFRSIQNFIGFFSAAILDVRKSLSIAFLAISDRSAILDVQNSLSMAFLAISDPYDKMAAGCHFGLDDNYRLLNEYSVLGPSSLVGI